MTDDRREQLRKALAGTSNRPALPSQIPPPPRRAPPTSEQARIQALQKTDPFRIHRGRLVGHGKWGTRINWGFWVITGAFMCYLITWVFWYNMAGSWSFAR